MAKMVILKDTEGNELQVKGILHKHRIDIWNTDETKEIILELFLERNTPFETYGELNAYLEDIDHSVINNIGYYYDDSEGTATIAMITLASMGIQVMNNDAISIGDIGIFDDMVI